MAAGEAGDVVAEDVLELAVGADEGGIGGTVEGDGGGGKGGGDVEGAGVVGDEEAGAGEECGHGGEVGFAGEVQEC